MKTEKVVNELRDALNLGKSSIKLVPMDETEITISKQNLLAAVRIILKSDIWHLSAITCQQEDFDFILLYHFWKSGGLTLRVELGEKTPQIQSICEIIPGAEYYEREAREMFGVEFLGMPNPAPLLLPDGWQGGYPMRKKGQPSREEIKSETLPKKGNTS